MAGDLFRADIRPIGGAPVRPQGPEGSALRVNTVELALTI
jgi:hypothetical protein